MPLRRHEACPSPGCPCYGLRAGSAEMTAASSRWRSRPPAARNLSGHVARSLLEIKSWLDYAAAASEAFDVEIRHEAL